MWLTRLALRNPIFILMMSLMTLALGWVALTRLPVDLFPNIDIPQIQVATFYTGAGPGDVEKSITVPIERAVSAAPGVDRVESVSKQGFSAVTVWFQYGVNLDNAQFEVQQRVAQILNTLPPGIDQPFIVKFDVSNIPVAFVSMSAEGLDERELYDLGYNVVEPQLERIKGVASAPIGGGKVREIQVLARERRAPLPRPHRARRGEHGPGLQPAPPQRHAAGRGPGLQRLLQHPDRGGPAAARRGGPAGRARGRQRPGGAGAHLRRGPGRRRHRRPDRDRARERGAGRLLPGPEAARRQHRRRGRPAAQGPARACAASPPA